MKCLSRPLFLCFAGLQAKQTSFKNASFELVGKPRDEEQAAAAPPKAPPKWMFWRKAAGPANQEPKACCPLRFSCSVLLCLALLQPMIVVSCLQ